MIVDETGWDWDEIDQGRTEGKSEDMVASGVYESRLHSFRLDGA